MAAVEALVWQSSAQVEWQDVHVTEEVRQGDDKSDGESGESMADSAAAGGILLPNSWLIAWRVRNGSRHILDVQQAHILEASEFCGLRIHFPARLEFVDFKATPSGAVLAALLPDGILFSCPLPASASGVALGQLRPSNFRRHSLAAPLSRLGGATQLAVAAEHVLVGTKAGTLLTCALQTEHGEVGELKEAERGLGRLWRGLGAGTPAGSPICAVATLQLRSADVGLALHVDATLRLWHLQTREQMLRVPALHVPQEADGYVPSGLVAVDSSARMQRVAVGYRHSEEPRQVVCLYTLDEGNGAAVFVQSIAVEGHVSSLAFSPGGITLLVAPTVDAPPHLEQRTWERQTVGAPLSVVPASRYVEARLLLADDPADAVDHLWATLEDQDLPDVSALYVERFLSAGVLSDDALSRTLAARGCPSTLDRPRKDLAQTLRRAAKLPADADPSTAFYCWRAFAHSYAATWADLHRPLGLATDSNGNFAVAVNSHSIAGVRAADKSEQDQLGTLPTTPAGPASLERCMGLIWVGLGAGAVEFLVELLLGGSNAQAVLDAFLSALEGGLSSSDGDRGRHKEDRERSLQLRQSVERLSSFEGGWEGVLREIKGVIAGIEVGPEEGSESTVGVGSSVGAGFVGQAVGAGVRQVVAAKLAKAQQVLLLVGLVQRWGPQVGVPPAVLSAVRSDLLPASWQLLSSLLLVHTLCTIPAATLTAPTDANFSQRLSTLRLGDIQGPPSSPPGTLSLADVTLAAQGWSPPAASIGPLPAGLLQTVHGALSSLRWRAGGRQEPRSVVERTAELGVLLLQQNQHAALKVLLQRTMAVAVSVPLPQENAGETSGGGAAALHFLNGLCCLATAGVGESGLQDEALAAFLKAGASVGSADPLLASVLRLFSPQLASTATTPATASSAALHRLHYLDLVLSLLECYGHIAGALHCARAALQEVDAAYPATPPPSDADPDPDGDLMLSGSDLALSSSQAREVHESLLWGHVFDLALRLRRYGEAYAAIVSNPDADSGGEKLRRLITVLCEVGAIEVLCGQQLAYAGNLERVHYELARKAETSDVGAPLNPYRVLFAFHSIRHNWRQAAAAMQRFAERVAQEVPVSSSSVRAQAESILAAITALRLLPEDSAWLAADSQQGPSKRQRIEGEPGARPRVTVGVADLEQQHAILLARLFLLQRPQESIRRRAEGTEAVPEVLWLLLEAAAFDQALSLATACLKGASLRKELGSIFRSLAGACCRAQAQEEREVLLDRSSAPRPLASSSLDGFSPLLQERTADDSTASAATLWRSLQAYLERYDTVEHNFAFRTLVADVVLSSSSGKRTSLPPWLAQLCKAGDPAALLRVLLDHGRLTEVAEVALDLLDKPRQQRSSDLVGSQQLSAVWVPHTLLAHLQQALAHGGHVSSARRAELQHALAGALQQHVNQMVSDTSTLRAVA